MTPAQSRVLELLKGAPMDEMGMTVHGIRRRTMQTLIDAGLVKFRPYGKPPTYVLTNPTRPHIAGKTMHTSPKGYPVMRDTIGCMTAKTNAERQRDFRARKKAEQEEEVRGVFAPKHLHDAIKEQIKKFIDKQKTA